MSTQAALSHLEQDIREDAVHQLQLRLLTPSPQPPDHLLHRGLHLPSSSPTGHRPFHLTQHLCAKYTTAMTARLTNTISKCADDTVVIGLIKGGDEV